MLLRSICKYFFILVLVLVVLSILLVSEKEKISCLQNGIESNSIIDGEGKCTWQITLYLKGLNVNLIDWDTWFDGEWKDGRPHGKGTYQSLSKSIYSGFWHNGTRQGSGEFVLRDRTTWKGEWVNDSLTCKNAVLSMKRLLDSGRDKYQDIKINWNNASYIGDVKDGLLHGSGILNFDDKIIVNAHFKDGFIHTVDGSIKYINETFKIIRLNSNLKYMTQKFDGILQDKEGNNIIWNGEELKIENSEDGIINELSEILKSVSAFELNFLQRSHQLISEPFDFKYYFEGANVNNKDEL